MKYEIIYQTCPWTTYLGFVTRLLLPILEGRTDRPQNSSSFSSAARNVKRRKTVRRAEECQRSTLPVRSLKCKEKQNSLTVK